MAAFEDYFSVQVFFLVFRETLETAVIVSVLLAFVKRGFNQPLVRSNYDDSSTSTETDNFVNASSASNIINTQQDELTEADVEAEEYRVRLENAKNIRLYKALRAQIWVGCLLGLVICMFIGGSFLYAFYSLGTDLWNSTEKLWEGGFSILASLIISVMGLAMIRINKMKEKWRVKLAQAIIQTHHGQGRWGLRYLSRKYALAILPMITSLREGLEAIVFVGGIGINQPVSSFPLPVLAAFASGCLVGWGMYRGGNQVRLQYFMIGSSCFLYLVAAGLFSRGVWFFEMQMFINKVGYDPSENGSGPGSYDRSHSVWHVNCCNPETDGWWMIFNSLLGWQNSATYASVISYNLYWLTLVAVIVSKKYKEDHDGYVPLIPRAYQDKIRQKKARRQRAAAAIAADNSGYNGQEDTENLIRRATDIYTQGEFGQVSSRRAGVPRVSQESLNSNSPLIQPRG